MQAHTAFQINDPLPYPVILMPQKKVILQLPETLGGTGFDAETVLPALKMWVMLGFNGQSQSDCLEDPRPAWRGLLSHGDISKMAVCEKSDMLTA